MTEQNVVDLSKWGFILHANADLRLYSVGTNSEHLVLSARESNPKYLTAGKSRTRIGSSIEPNTLLASSRSEGCLGQLLLVVVSSTYAELHTDAFILGTDAYIGVHSYRGVDHVSLLSHVILYRSITLSTH